MRTEMLPMQGSVALVWGVSTLAWLHHCSQNRWHALPCSRPDQPPSPSVMACCGTQPTGAPLLYPMMSTSGSALLHVPSNPSAQFCISVFDPYILTPAFPNGMLHCRHINGACLFRGLRTLCSLVTLSVVLAWVFLAYTEVEIERVSN